MNNINGIGLVGDSSTWTTQNTTDAFNSGVNLTNSIFDSINKSRRQSMSMNLPRSRQRRTSRQA